MFMPGPGDYEVFPILGGNDPRIDDDTPEITPEEIAKAKDEYESMKAEWRQE